MKEQISPRYFPPREKGATVLTGSVSFCTDMSDALDGGVLIYDEQDNVCRLPFSPQGRRGSLCALNVDMSVTDKHTYLYYRGSQTFLDREAKIIVGNEEWGRTDEKKLRGAFYLDDFDWGRDVAPNIPWHESFIYGLNVRAFTMHASSGVKSRGSFAGVSAKIPYLQSLGVTAVELMPAYDFNEVETITDPANGKESSRLNCWGFKAAHYYAPKTAYAGGERADHAFKSMVKSFHKNGMEVHMCFYFTPEISAADTLAILRFWVLEYHIDGIHLIGHGLPFALITHDALLSGTKLSYHEQDYWEDMPRYANTGLFRDAYLADVRRLIRGDEDMTAAFMYRQKDNMPGRGVINYLAAYGGFSLFDSVAFDKKHNAANGEKNRDGSDKNYSWNCGAEGVSRKKAIVALRTKQIKNALSLLFMSQGVPYIFSGDEFGNSRHGNNNAYCQDNDTGWVKWSKSATSQELLSYTRMLSVFRKSHPILRMKETLRGLDWQRCGYPDVSYHGAEAWRPDLYPISRTLGIMLCGTYAKYNNQCADAFIYLAINMHWQKATLALPHLPQGLVWQMAFSSYEGASEPGLKKDSILMNERCVCVFISAHIDN